MNRRISNLACVAAILLLAGCAQVSHVASGDVVLRGKMVVALDKPWNQFERGIGNNDNTPTWTQDGIAVDTLRFYVGLRDGDLIVPTPTQPAGQKPLAFKAGMQTNDVIALFEGLYSRGGSSFKLDKVTPQPFMGSPGFRFEFSGIRKRDDVRLAGVAWGMVRNGELYAITYTAPRLAFFGQHLKSAEAIAASARLKS